MPETSTPEVTATFRMATKDDSDLETYDHTKLSAVNVCPTWGIVRYQMHKTMAGTGRSMPLEAGHAMHEVFSWVRLCTLGNQLENKPEGFADECVAYHGRRLFGETRYNHIRDVARDAEDLSDATRRGAIAVLDTSGFYDDPRDKRRTMSNLEECAYAYINRWRWDHPVWMRDPEQPTSDVGIEIPFDVVVEISGLDIHPFRLTGRIDGIHWDALSRLTVHDNKTASRLGDAWSQSQYINHQYTGYCVAASCFTQDVVNYCDVLGLAIPLPKSYDYGGFDRVSITKHLHHIRRWVHWLSHTVLLTRVWANDPIHAPKYTHSCNRYFRACMLIPYCDGDDEEQRRILEEMVVDEWSPLNKPILDGVGDE